jgi:hypothetical protein
MPPLKSDYSQRVVAYIYGTIPITREELGEYLIARMGSERINNLINRRIIEHVCQQKGIEVTQAEVEADLAETIKGLNLHSAKEFENTLLKRPPYNKTLYEWKEDAVRPRLLLTKLCRERVHVTDEDLKKAYEAYYGEKIECRIIMWQLEMKHHVEMEIYPKIRDSEAEFDKEAKKQASPNLAAHGGRLEKPIGRNTTGNEDMERAIFNLQPGEVSRLIETPEGLVVFKCDKRIPASTAVKLEDVRDRLTKECMDRKIQIEIAKVFKELRDEAKPQNFLSPEDRKNSMFDTVAGEIKQGEAAPAAASH